MPHHWLDKSRTSTLFLLGAFAIIFDEQRRLLLCHRCDDDVWNLPGGGVEDGELPHEAAVRETKEETGLDVEIIRLVGVYAKPGSNDLVFSFECQVVAGEILTTSESDQVRYFPLDQLPPNTLPFHIERIQDAIHHLEIYPLFRRQTAQPFMPNANFSPGQLTQDHFDSTSLTLIEPDALYKLAFYEMMADFQSAGESFFHDYTDMVSQDFSGYVRFLRNQAVPASTSAGSLPQSTYWLLYQNQKIYGVSRLRHSLSPSLDLHGGHISLAVQPTMRRKGLGTTCLRLTLQKAHQLGLKRVLLTCDAGNLASIKMIRKCGGQLDHRDSEISHPSTYHFWINLD